MYEKKLELSVNDDNLFTITYDSDESQFVLRTSSDGMPVATIAEYGIKWVKEEDAQNIN